MTTKDFLQSYNSQQFYCVPSAFMQLGFVQAHVLAKLIRLYFYYAQQNEVDFIYLNTKQIADEFKIHTETVKRVIKKLQNAQLIKTKRQGFQFKLYFKLNIEKIYQLINYNQRQQNVVTSDNKLLSVKENQLQQNVVTKQNNNNEIIDNQIVNLDTTKCCHKRQQIVVSEKQQNIKNIENQEVSKKQQFVVIEQNQVVDVKEKEKRKEKKETKEKEKRTKKEKENKEKKENKKEKEKKLRAHAKFLSAKNNFATPKNLIYENEKNALRHIPEENDLEKIAEKSIFTADFGFKIEKSIENTTQEKSRLKNTQKSKNENLKIAGGLTETQKTTKKQAQRSKKQYVVQYPIWWNDELQELFDAFVEHRKKMRKPMTDYAKYLQIKNLEKLVTKYSFMQPAEAAKMLIERALLRGWQAFYHLSDAEYKELLRKRSGGSGLDGIDLDKFVEEQQRLIEESLKDYNTRELFNKAVNQ